MMYNVKFEGMRPIEETHFTLTELTKTNFKVENNPNAGQEERLRRLAGFLETIREKLGRPLIINQAFRSQKLSETMRLYGYKPSKTSAHLRGDAADLCCMNERDAIEICAAIFAAAADYGWQWDQVILEKSKTSVWVHFGLNAPSDKPRMQFWIQKV